MEICGDNRFEIIAKAKADLLEGTNIETDEAEMAVIDNILFRCWQMGWLDRYDRKTESNSEKPNNCECEPRKEQNFCGKCRYLYRDFKYGLSCYRLMDNEPCKYEERKESE